MKVAYLHVSVNAISFKYCTVFCITTVVLETGIFSSALVKRVSFSQKSIELYSATSLLLKQSQTIYQVLAFKFGFRPLTK